MTLGQETMWDHFYSSPSPHGASDKVTQIAYIICVILAILFNAMIIPGVVPSMFGLGIVVPLIKGHNLDNSISENYRVLIF